MQKPLWSFFIVLREQMPYALSIDQYAYFFQAFQQFPFGHFQSKKDLLEFCKLFWLVDESFENQFDQLFNQLVNLEISFEPEIIEPTKPITPIDRTPTKFIKKKFRPAPKPTPNIVVENVEEEIEMDDETIVNFELVLQDKDSFAYSNPTPTHSFKNQFNLNDQAIMPFGLRHFAQQLRRSVSTSVKEMTDELDVTDMINQYSKNQYIDQIKYQFQESNTSDMVFLSERYGSMLSYEFIERQIRTAMLAIPGMELTHYYFNETPLSSSTPGHFLLKNASFGQKDLDTNKNKWTNKHRFLIFSDAGAHAGMVDKTRLRNTLKFWLFLQQFSSHIYWFNPVPKVYFKGTTAERLNRIIPMVYPSQKELHKFFFSV